jgi:hypothetical protein
VATLAALPAYVAQPLEAELEAASKSKHGRILVGEPELRGGTFTQHHVFKVSSSAGAVEHVFRRYTDFVWLRNVLVKAFPGIFIPPLPEKKALGNKDSTFVESRRLDLQRWLARIVARDFLADHEGVALFLHRATSSFEDDCKALTKATDAKPLHEIISLYMDLFPELARLPASESASFDVEAIRDFLASAETKMTVLAAAADKFVQANYSAVQDLGRLNTALQADVEGEKAFVTSPPTSLKERGPAVHPRVDVVDSFIAWHLSLKWSSNAYDDLLLSPLKFELQDIQAMIETVRGRMDLFTRHQKSVAKAAKWTLSPANFPKNEKQEVRIRTLPLHCGCGRERYARKQQRDRARGRTHSSIVRHRVHVPALKFFSFVCSVPCVLALFSGSEGSGRASCEGGRAAVGPGEQVDLARSVRAVLDVPHAAVPHTSPSVRTRADRTDQATP